MSGNVETYPDIVITEVEMEDGRLVADPPLALTPRKCLQSFVSVGEPSIDLLDFAESMDELRASIPQQIAMLWVDYVIADPAKLTPDALRLREALRARFRWEAK